MVHIEDILHGQEIDPEARADLLDAGGILQSVDAHSKASPRDPCRIRTGEIVAKRLLEPIRRITQQMNMGFGSALAVVGEFFGEQIVFIVRRLEGIADGQMEAQTVPEFRNVVIAPFFGIRIGRMDPDAQIGAG